MTTSERPPRRSALHPVAIAALVNAVAIQAWFRPGQFIASGDISPFERRGLSRELFWSWNHQGTPDGGAAASGSRWPEVLVARLGDGLGLDGSVSQRVFLTLLAAILGASMAWMLAPLVQRRAVLVGAGLVAMATPITLVTLPNHLAFVAMSAVATLGGAAIRTALGRPPRPALLVWTTVLVGYLTVNPPLLAVVSGFTIVAFVGAIVVAARRSSVAIAPQLGFGIALALAACLIWIVPFAFTILQPSELGSFVAPIEVEQWAWTHVRASLGNVVNLTGHWTWQQPEYMPFVRRLDAQPFDWLRWALPLSVAVAPLAQRDAARRRICVGILLATVPLIIVGKGLHEPFSGLNSWLYGHVPGLWLLREPLPKVGVVLVPLYVVGWALLFDAVAARLAHARWSEVERWFARTGVAVLAVLPLLFGWPVFTGAVFSGSEALADRAAVPPEWGLATRRLQGLDVAGKVLQLPLADYYQVGTTWGYYGADTLLSGRISAPVLQRLPGGYFTSRPAVDDLLGIAEEALSNGDDLRFREATERLGARAVVVRSDFRLDPSRPRLADPRVLRANLARLPGSSIVHDGAMLQVAQLSQRGLFTRMSTVRASNDPSVLGGPGTASVATTEGILPRGLSQGLVAVGPAAGATVEVDRAGPYRLQVADGSALTYRARVLESGVSLQPETAMALDGRPVPLEPLATFGPLDDAGLLGAGAKLVDPSADDARLVVPSGSTISVYRPIAPDARLDLRRLQDCAKADERSLDEVGISLRADDGVNGVSTLAAREHRACIPIALSPPAGGRALRISYGEQVINGQPADPCLLDMGSNRCLPVSVERRAGSADLIAALPDVPGPVTLFLYADAGSAVRYGSPRVRWFERSSDRKVSAESPPVVLDVGSHSVSIDKAGALAVGQRTDVGNCAGTENPALAGIAASEDADGILELSAVRGSACVQFPVARLGGELRVVFQHRSNGPGTPRFCLWWYGLNRCASARPLSRSARWATTDRTFTVPDGATSAGLFLYADGGGDGDRRAMTYRSVRFADSTPLVATLIPADAPAPAAPQGLASSVDRSGNHRVFVPPSATPTLLRFADRWSPRWQAKLRGRTLTHLQVDGFANGWVLPSSDKALVVDVDYRPSGPETLGLAVGFLTLAGVTIGELVVYPARRRRRPFRSESL